MTKMAEIGKRYREELESKYGSTMTAEQRQALSAIIRCRTVECGSMLAVCPDCGKFVWRNHSCGHRHCPQCQGNVSGRWLERQRQKLLPVKYFLVTFTLPQELRMIAKYNQRLVYGLLFSCSIGSMRELGMNPRYLGGEIGAAAVLHTHSRRLDYHPHVHCIVPAGAIDKVRREWKWKTWKFLFPVRKLSAMFRDRLLYGLKEHGVGYPKEMAGIDWVVNCKPAGGGSEVQDYLARYLYRGIVSENNLSMNPDNTITFTYTDGQTGEIGTRTLEGAEFLHLVIQHVLPKGFRRVRDYGYLHGNSRRMLQLVQLVMYVKIQPKSSRDSGKFVCPECGGRMEILVTKVFLVEKYMEICVEPDG